MSPTSSENIVGGFAASESISRIQNDRHVDSEINSLSDLIQTGRNKQRKTPVRINEETYQFCKNLILNLDDWVEFTKEEIEEMDVPELIDNFEENKEELIGQYETVEEALTRVNDSIIEDMNSPSTYYSLKKFFDVSKVFFEKTVRMDKDELREIDQEKLQNAIEKDDFFVEMGVLVSFQPYLVKAVLMADKKNDTKFLSEYESTVNDRIRELFYRNKGWIEEFMEA